ncbi:hypothetical protein [Robertmurraya sp. FSL R5-0851]|uniref:hypothetical protein n=1 Tax=Robertmurraya sp. FSL R5-0851 TaxID=2921584 RepID=UPI0030FC0378
MIEKGLIVAETSEENLREKLLQLTIKGLESCKEMKEIKEQIEKEITDTLGQEKVTILKDILKVNWYRS